eukprot:5776650-Pyramimonas_sp.AAC.1
MPGSLGAKTDAASPRLDLEILRLYRGSWAPAETCPVPRLLFRWDYLLRLTINVLLMSWRRLPRSLHKNVWLARVRVAKVVRLVLLALALLAAASAGLPDTHLRTGRRRAAPRHAAG